jgi:hypothetical protein
MNPVQCGPRRPHTQSRSVIGTSVALAADRGSWLRLACASDRENGVRRGTRQGKPLRCDTSGHSTMRHEVEPSSGMSTTGHRSAPAVWALR